MMTKTRAGRRVRLAACILIATVASAGAAAASPPAAVQADTLEDALELYSQCKWSAAYGRLVRLADEGQAEAAAIALLMLRYGAQLYGHEWGASPAQIDHWIALSRRRTEALKVARDE